MTRGRTTTLGDGDSNVKPKLRERGTGLSPGMWADDRAEGKVEMPPVGVGDFLGRWR